VARKHLRQAPVFATVLILTIAVVGFVGYKTSPSIASPTSTSRSSRSSPCCPARRPQEIETEVSDKIEEAINTDQRHRRAASISTEGVSQVIVSFQLDKDINVAAQEVREHVSTVLPDLPEGTKSPVINKLDPDAAPVLFVALESNRPIRDVTEFADHEVRQALENVAGVGQVTIVGGRSARSRWCSTR
jgi:multidrug efflux pump subunit AcrB